MEQALAKAAELRVATDELAETVALAETQLGALKEKRDAYRRELIATRDYCEAEIARLDADASAAPAEETASEESPDLLSDLESTE